MQLLKCELIVLNCIANIICSVTFKTENRGPWPFGSGAGGGGTLSVASCECEYYYYGNKFPSE